MKHAIFGTLVIAFALSCAGQQKTNEQARPQCLSHCSNQFAACTERHPGDFSACRQDRSTCESECKGQEAMERMESEDEDVVIDSNEEPEPTPEETDEE